MRGLHNFEEGSRSELFLHVSGPSFAIVGDVANISVAGVTYDYVESDVQHPEFVTVDIFSLCRNFNIRGIECKVTGDAPIENGNPRLTARIRRCTLCFINVAEEQARLLWLLFGQRRAHKKRSTR